MPDFNPDAYLQQVKPEKPFDPNAYLSQMGKPPVTPDAADKAARPNDEYLPLYSAHSWAVAGSRLMHPGQTMDEMQQYKASHPNQALAPTTGDDLGAASLAVPVEGLPAGLSKLASYLSSSAPLRIGTNAAVGGVQGALNNPQDRLLGAAKGAGIGGGLAAAGEGLSYVTSKGADKLMQIATGLKKESPGIGNKLVDLGVMGTKSQMQDQVASKLASEEEGLQEIVGDLKGTVNSKEIADAVANKAGRFTLPSTGQASPFSEQELSKVRGMADKISGMGDLSAQDLLALKRQGDYAGYAASGNPATSVDAELGRAGANAARGALKKMAPDAADALLNEQALVKAQAGLNKPEPLGKGLPSLFGASALGAGAGALLGGPLGAAVGAGAANVAKLPITQATTAHALQRGVSPLGKLLSNPIIDQLLTKKATE